MKFAIERILKAAFLLALSVHLAQADEKVMVDRVLVIVNEGVITQSEFDFRYQSLLQDLKRENAQLPPELPVRPDGPP